MTVPSWLPDAKQQTRQTSGRSRLAFFIGDDSILQRPTDIGNGEEPTPLQRWGPRCPHGVHGRKCDSLNVMTKSPHLVQTPVNVKNLHLLPLQSLQTPEQRRGNLHLNRQPGVLAA